MACVEHVWELREIALSLDGSLETWECVRCGAVASDRPLGHRAERERYDSSASGTSSNGDSPR